MSPKTTKKLATKKKPKKSKTPKPTAGMPAASKRLLAYLEKKKLTYAAFGEKIGVTKAWICSLVKGGTPSLRVAQAIEKETKGLIPEKLW